MKDHANILYNAILLDGAPYIRARMCYECSMFVQYEFLDMNFRRI